MDERTINNWRKIKETMEASGKTDNHFYKRAVAILAGKPDPMDVFSPTNPGNRRSNHDQ